MLEASRFDICQGFLQKPILFNWKSHLPYALPLKTNLKLFKNASWIQIWRLSFVVFVPKRQNADQYCLPKGFVNRISLDFIACRRKEKVEEDFCYEINFSWFQWKHIFEGFFYQKLLFLFSWYIHEIGLKSFTDRKIEEGIFSLSYVCTDEGINLFSNLSSNASDAWKKYKENHRTVFDEIDSEFMCEICEKSQSLMPDVSFLPIGKKLSWASYLPPKIDNMGRVFEEMKFHDKQQVAKWNQKRWNGKLKQVNCSKLLKVKEIINIFSLEMEKNSFLEFMIFFIEAKNGTKNFKLHWWFKTILPWGQLEMRDKILNYFKNFRLT